MIIKNLRILASAVMVTLMVFIAELSGQTEMIFPEAAALVMGAWITGKQPWNTDRSRIVVCMTVSAFVGWIISAFLSTFLCIKIIIGFAICLILLILSKCTLFPLISACILPIMTNVKSVFYPVSVMILSAIIIIVQYAMEIKKIRKPVRFCPVIFDLKTDGKKWLVIFSLVVFMALAVEFSGASFILAPPLIVLLCEFMQKDSKPAKTPFIMFFLTGLCACFGTCMRLMLCDMLHLPLTAAALIISVSVFYFMMMINTPFPPACALSLLPLIITTDQLPPYPFEVMFGCAVLIIVSELTVKKLYKGASE